MFGHKPLVERIVNFMAQETGVPITDDEGVEKTAFEIMDALEDKYDPDKKVSTSSTTSPNLTDEEKARFSSAESRGQNPMTARAREYQDHLEGVTTVNPPPNNTQES